MQALVLAMMIAGSAPVIPPLTPPQREQLAHGTQDDSPNFDESGLYPLLSNALAWHDGDERWAVVPDYDAMLKSPAQYRGQLMLIEGRFAGVPSGRQSLTVHGLTRPGPWDGKLEQWPILVRTDPDLVVLAYLVNPPPLPTTGRQVRLAARFYKVWNHPDQNNEMTNYLTFVGHGTQVPAASANAAQEQPSMAMLLLVVIVILAGALVLVIKRWGRLTLAPRPLPSRVQRSQSDDFEELAPGVYDDEPGAPLPEAPADALGVLSHAHEEQQEGLDGQPPPLSDDEHE